ncbi:hypothetical protein [Flavobacterium cerinum]|uniref:Lipoprotein n=1 Tax=Flavobacterium cerinum TaxID=2502784 RepID=A0A444HC03_9FLAO|nr:hypothetical protein [Flavobacterium cerinum]RWX00989.1 hypothetical protein EPI11_08180 [Flavobacterium cerinum]
MKKLLFLLLSVSLFSCSGSDDNSTNSLHPPTWIQGTWGQDYGDNITVKTFRFSANGAYIISSNSEMSINPNSLLKIKEEITNTKYDINLSGGGTNLYFRFEKIGTNKIKYYNQQSSALNVTLVKLD